MTDYRNRVGKKKQRQTGITIAASEWGGGGGSSDSGGSSSDSDDSSSSSSDSGGSSSLDIQWDPDTNSFSDSGGGGSDTSSDSSTSDTQSDIEKKDQFNQTTDYDTSSDTSQDSESEDRMNRDLEDVTGINEDTASGTASDDTRTNRDELDNNDGGTFGDVGNLIPDVDAPSAEEVVEKASGEVNEAVSDAEEAVEDTEEAVDDATSGDGFLSGAADVVDSVTSTVPIDPTGGVGPLSQAIAKQFDNKKGGGIADKLGDTVGEAEEALSGLTGSSGGTSQSEGDSQSEGENENDEKPVKWSPIKSVSQVKGAVIFKQTAQNTEDDRVRFFAIGQAEDGSKVAFGRGDKAVKVDSVENVGKLPHFSSKSAAKDVVPHRQERAPDRRKSQNKTQWQKPKKVNQIGSVAIMEQVGEKPKGGTKFRYYAITKSDNGTVVLLQSADKVVRLPEIDGFDEAPNFSNQGAAEQAATGYMERVTPNDQPSTNVVGAGSGAEGQPSITTTTEQSPRSPQVSSTGLGAGALPSLSPSTLGLGALVVGGGIYAATRGDEGGPIRVVRANLGQSGRNTR